MEISPLCYPSWRTGDINGKCYTNALLTSGSTTPRHSSRLTCYTDSLLQWSATIGLSLHQHVAIPAPPQIPILRALLEAPTSTPIQITLRPAIQITLRPAIQITLRQHLTTIASDLQTTQGTGTTGITITHTSFTGKRTTIQIRIATPTELLSTLF